LIFRFAVAVQENLGAGFASIPLSCASEYFRLLDEPAPAVYRPLTFNELQRWHAAQVMALMIEEQQYRCETAAPMNKFLKPCARPGVPTWPFPNSLAHRSVKEIAPNTNARLDEPQPYYAK